MNFDFDRQLRSLAIPLAAGASVSEVAFSDATGDPSNDRSAMVATGSVSFAAPPSLGLDWGRMARFAFTTNATPDIASLALESLEAGTPSSFAIGAAIPVPEPAQGAQVVCGVLLLAFLDARRRRSGRG